MSQAAKDSTADSVWVEILDLVEDYSFGYLFRVIKARLRHRRFDGSMSQQMTRINFERGDSVGVLLFDPDEDVVVLTRQFRYPVYASIAPEMVHGGEAKQAWLLEVAAGIIEPGQSAVEIASKEVLEEAGYELRRGLRPIATVYPSPGGSSERITLFLGLVDHQDRSDKGSGLSPAVEDIQVESYSFSESIRMIEQGEISDAKTIIALQHLALLKNRGVDLKQSAREDTE